MPRTTHSELHAKLVGERIRAVRDELELTQAELGRRLGVSSAYVQKVEAGRANPTLGQLANIASALDAVLEVTFPPRVRQHDPLEQLAEV